MCKKREVNEGLKTREKENTGINFKNKEER